ncbi:hypothetical protein Aph01nite_29200 [Acrocarpospora phusangensis]|uniref:Wadjet protein JetD C-terminal domain-containing protein n=1 Tax=Acrocarpospora phusangensis TaxID=1070424 RepID=A0A919QDJ6_9ACTN|nr:Wadjet anti-phage system protein JetD domain-containing protein [Acrocarpospora phusangensis]GIH24610.1 hypothetical protein Aph01nite_29200 [Acrocarpospora phusangensis]
MHLLFGEREGRERASIGGLPPGVVAVTVPVRRNGQGHLPRNKRGQPNIEIVDLVAEGPTSAYRPPETLDSRELIFALEAGRRDWATVVGYFGADRVSQKAIDLVVAGGVILRCAVDDDLDLAQPLSWRRSHSWSLMHVDVLHDLRGRPDPDALRGELIRKMMDVSELDGERTLLEAVASRSPLRVPNGSATRAGAWSVYEHALRAAIVWFPHNADGGDKLTANDLAGRAFLDSKAWTPEREAAFSNLIGQGFDQAVDKADTDLRLRGPLTWTLGSVAADANVARPWIALPARGIRAAGNVSCSAVGVLIVENADTFEKVCKIPGVPERWLCVWGEGYSSDGMVHLLRDLDLPVAAWCDLDAHGIQIIHVLEGKLGRLVHSLGMDLELWEKTPHRKNQKAKTVDGDKKLAAKLALKGPVSLRPLAKEIAKYGGSCEQQPIQEGVLPLLPRLLENVIAGAGRA